TVLPEVCGLLCGDLLNWHTWLDLKNAGGMVFLRARSGLGGFWPSSLEVLWFGLLPVLLKAFIGNLNSNSPTIRRTAAAATVSICQHSRRTQYFYTRLLQVLLGLLCPKEEEHPSVLILGVLLTLRYLIPLLQQEVKDTSLKGSFGVYELSLHYTQHRDHNVVTGSLELLQQLLRTPPPNLLLALTMRGGLLHADAAKDEIVSRSRSDSIVELIAKVLSGEESLEDDSEAKSETSQMGFAGSVKSELNSELTSMSGVSPAASSASDPPGCDIITEQPRSQHVLQSESEISACDLTGATPKADTDDDILSRSSSQIKLQRSHLPKSVSHRREPSNSSMEKFGPKEETELADNGSKLSRMKGDIGGYKDGSAAPLVHCVRLLSASFLLTGEKGDKDVRVSVKALAISCVGAAVALHPEAFFSKLYKMPTESNKEERGSLKDESSVTCKLACIAVRLLKLQDRVLKEVVISLLGDEDPRVRRVAAAALVRLVPKLYSSCDAGQADPVVALAKEQSSIYLKLLMHETPPTSHFSHPGGVEESQEKSAMGMVGLLLSFLSSISFPLDLSAHQDALILAGNLLAEDIVLSRIQELSFSPHLISCQTIHRLRNGGNKIPPTQEIPTDEQDRFLPEETFSRDVPKNHSSGYQAFYREWTTRSSFLHPRKTKRSCQVHDSHPSIPGSPLHLTWLTVNHVQELISLSHEPPVQDFISAIHRNSAASGLFIQAIQSRCENFASNSTAQLPVEELDRIQEYLQNAGLAHR
ncbi:hypothetical protein E2320_007936, partial [Naja naja]